MHKAVFPIFCLLSFGWSSAYAAPPAKTSKNSPNSLCKVPEIALYDCEMSNTVSVASICQRDQKVIFRFSDWWGTPELEVESNGRDGRAHQYVAHIGGGPSGSGWSALQYTMRFTWRGVNFYSHVTDSGKRRLVSGLAIEKDNVTLSNKICKTVRHPEFQIPNFVEEETDEKHRGIY